MELTAENYFSEEADREYMSVSQFKSFAGTLGKSACEYKALESLNRRWEDETTEAMLIGSYVDSYFEGTLETFKSEHPEIYKKDGDLLAKFQHANDIIKRIESDKYFMFCLRGEKQRIMTGEIGGVKWKIKMDSYIEGDSIVDLKIVKAVDGKDGFNWVRDYGPMLWVYYWGYDIQGAVYQEIVRQNTGLVLPFRLAAASKEKEPSIRVIGIEQERLNQALTFVKTNLPRVLSVKNGETAPDRCELCDCCRRNRVLNGPIWSSSITEAIE